MIQKRYLVALLGCMALSALITWPAVIQPTAGLIGHPGNDTWNHAWGLWWVFDGITDRGGLPLHSNLLNYPDGGTLFFIDTFNALLTLPIQWLFGLVFAYNFTVFFGIAWTAFGGWALANHIHRDAKVAWVSAAVFGCNAHLLGQTYNGITETINAGWIPIFLLALLRHIERPSLKRGALVGFTFALSALWNFYYGLFSMLIGVVVLLAKGIGLRDRMNWGGLFKGLVVGAVVSIAMVLPVLATLSHSMDSPDAMVSRDPQFVWDSLLRHNYTDVIGFFRPGDHYSPDLKAEFGEELIIVTYLGWCALALAAVALFTVRRRGELRLWAAISAVFLIFALGPYLYIGSSQPVEIGGRLLPLPFLPFFEAFPIFSRISHPFRFVVPAMLGISILAGYGARQIARGQSSKTQGALYGLFGGLVVAETLLISPAVWPLPRSVAEVPEVYYNLEDEGAVLDLPITVPNLERGVYTYYQTVHERSVPYGLNEPVPARLRQNRLTDFILYVESGFPASLPPTLPILELVEGARILQLMGYRYIVLHERFLIEPKVQMIATVLDAVVGPPRHYPEDGVSLYDLGRMGE